MASLLEDLLKRNSHLQLVSLKTLPVARLNEPTPQEQPPAADRTASGPAAAGQARPEDKDPAEMIYKHGVELVVEGSYADILTYLTQLESMPWQVFWSRARLQVDNYPRASLSLTLFTLSLDQKWLNI